MDQDRQINSETQRGPGETEQDRLRRDGEDMQPQVGRPARAAWAEKTQARLRLLRGCITLTGSVVLVLGLLLLILPCFKVKKIEVSGDLGMMTEQEIIDASGVQIGDEIIGMDLQAVVDRLDAHCPNVLITVMPTPFSIKIKVEPRAAAYMEYAGQFFSLDRDLHVLDVSPTADRFSGLLKIKLPEVSGFSIGDRVDFSEAETDRTYIRTMFDLLDRLGLTDRVDLLDVSQKFNVAFVIDGSTRIVLGKVSDLEVKLELAGKMLAAREGEAPYAVVDVSDLKRSTYRPMESLDLLLAG